jgi:hypothetical protein
MTEKELKAILRKEHKEITKLDKQKHGSIEIFKYLQSKYDLGEFGAYDIYRMIMFM